jgi:hypothetical protein
VCVLGFLRNLNIHEIPAGAGGAAGTSLLLSNRGSGGKARNMHKAKRAERITGRGPEGEEIVFGMVERGGKVIASHVDSRKKKDLQPIIRERVEAGSAIAEINGGVMAEFNIFELSSLDAHKLENEADLLVAQNADGVRAMTTSAAGTLPRCR